MDTKLIKEFGTEICCYRIRSARQKKRMQYEDYDKRLIVLDRERCALFMDLHRPELEPLDPPVQRGWKRFFVLREDVARSRHAAFYEAILQKINTEDWSYRKDFKIKKRRLGRKMLVGRKQELKKLNEREFALCNFSEAEQACFHPEFIYHWWTRRFGLYYVFNEPWRFVLRVRPNMLEWKKKRDGLKESRLKRIDNYIKREYAYGRLVKAVYGSDREDKRYVKKPAYDPCKNKSFSQVLYMINEETVL